MSDPYFYELATEAPDPLLEEWCASNPDVSYLLTTFLLRYDEEGCGKVYRENGVFASEDTMTWYSATEDLLKLSRALPTYLFTLEAHPSEQEQEKEVTYFRGGYYHSIVGEDRESAPFDPSRFSTIDAPQPLPYLPEADPHWLADLSASFPQSEQSYWEAVGTFVHHYGAGAVSQIVSLTQASRNAQVRQQGLQKLRDQFPNIFRQS